MLCQRCHKNLATVRYAEVVDGRVANLHLCQECLSKQQEQGAAGFEISGKAPTPKGLPTTKEKTEKPVARRVCPSCGMKLSEVLSKDLVGCSRCYEVFGEVLEPRFRELHVALRHRGKTRRMENARERLYADLQTKRALLRTALKLENYEEAADLRDQIKALEADLTVEAMKVAPVASRGCPVAATGGVSPKSGLGRDAQATRRGEPEDGAHG